MHLFPLIKDLAIILGAGSLVSVIFQRIRQPVVLGYLIAGIIVGPYTPPISFVVDIQGVQIWAELGVIFLMFSLGLEFSFRKLTTTGRASSITAVVEVVTMLTLGFVMGKMFGWSSMDSAFLGAILSISSTTIIIKAFEELNLKSAKFTTFVFGVLVIEDILAILILVAFTAIASGEGLSIEVVIMAILKLILVIGSWLGIGYLLLPRLISRWGRKLPDESMTLLSLALCLGLVVIASYFQYSAALAAFIMGTVLSESSQVERIEGLMKPLRDVFAAVFFVSVGMLLDPKMIINNWKIILIITFVTVVGKILSTILGARLAGKSKKIALQSGLSLAQIGEFSFIIASVGLTLKVMNELLYPIAVAVSIITTFTTPYLIRLSQHLIKKMPEEDI